MFISLAINPTTYIVIFLLLGVVLNLNDGKGSVSLCQPCFFSYSPTVHSINGLPNNGTRNMTAPYLKGNNIHTASCWAATAIGTGNEADPNLARLPTGY